MDLVDVDGVFGLGLRTDKDQSFVNNIEGVSPKSFALLLTETDNTLYMGGYDISKLA